MTVKHQDPSDSSGEPPPAGSRHALEPAGAVKTPLQSARPSEQAAGGATTSPGATDSSTASLAGTGFHAAVPQRHHGEAHPTGKRLAWLSFTALGVVYGDIGTSPLYSMQQAFSPAYGLAPDETNVYGVLSMILWSLIVVVAVKYIAFIMSAANR